MSPERPARAMDISCAALVTIPDDFSIAPIVPVYCLADSSDRPKASAAVLANSSICAAPRPKVTSMTFWTSSISEASLMLSLPKLIRAAVPKAKPTTPASFLSDAPNVSTLLCIADRPRSKLLWFRSTLNRTEPSNPNAV